MDDCIWYSVFVALVVWFVAVCCLLCWWFALLILVPDLLVCLASFCWVGCLPAVRFAWWLSGLRVWVGAVRI